MADLNSRSHPDRRRHIYWANGLFTQADRSFNLHSAEKLRQAGYEVFLPQEATVNKDKAPSAKEIFRIDTSAILNSSLMVACLDQETIDSGVACEIGIGFAFNIPIVGLYTDIRQFRSGPGRMYKNLYTIGAVENVGEIVTNVDDLICSLPTYLDQESPRRAPPSSDHRPIQHFSAVAKGYDAFIARLESWYHPAWSPASSLDQWIRELRPRRLLEIGCGTGALGHRLCSNYPIEVYVGYDPAKEMIELAASSQSNTRCFFTSDVHEALAKADGSPFDMALALFTVHDHPKQEETIAWVTSSLKPGGALVLVDLSTEDLPCLTGKLRRDLARPILGKDTRLSPTVIARLAERCSCEIIQCNLSLPRVTFPSADDLLQYIEVFGIARGMDLPLGLAATDYPATKALITTLASEWSFPFSDQRVFICCLLRTR